VSLTGFTVNMSSRTAVGLWIIGIGLAHRFLRERNPERFAANFGSDEGIHPAGGVGEPKSPVNRHGFRDGSPHWCG
jgi:hypothetical protein